MNKIKKWLCKIGLHAMGNHVAYFTDVVSGKMVYHADCICGKRWMVDTKFICPLFKVEIEKADKKLIKEFESLSMIENELMHLNNSLKRR